MTLAAIMYALSNFVIFVMLVCMLQSAFEFSSRGFRLVQMFLAAAALGAFFFGLSAATEAGARELMYLGEVIWVEVVKSSLFALVLVLMRLAQIARGADTHSKQREGAQLARRAAPDYGVPG